MSVSKSTNGALCLAPLAGRGRIAPAIRVRGAFRKSGRDGFEDTRYIAENVIIPESQYTVVVFSEPFVANPVVRVVGMLSAIDLDYETSFSTNKIDGVRADRLLPNKFLTVKATRSQAIPQRGFSVRRLLPQPPGTLDLHLFGSAQVAIPPHPSRFAREE